MPQSAFFFNLYNVITDNDVEEIPSAQWLASARKNRRRRNSQLKNSLNGLLALRWRKRDCFAPQRR
jgi:hypothetical protein